MFFWHTRDIAVIIKKVVVYQDQFLIFFTITNVLFKKYFFEFSLSGAPGIIL